MFRKFTVFLLVALLTTWTPAGLLAEGGEAPLKGKFFAAGEGFLHLEGGGSVVLESHLDKAVILIHNISKTKVEVVGKGKIIPLPKENALLLLGFKGKVDLKGKALSFTSIGGPVKVDAKGKGVVWLRGEGLFKIGNNQPHKWPKAKIKKFKY